jgi:tRNA(fMet)-specific endonuclease VapC
MSFLLDTDTCSFHLKRPSGLMHRFMQHSGGLFLPTIALAELYVWAYRRSNPAKLLHSIARDLLAEVAILDFDTTCAEQFGMIRGALLQRGLQVDTADFAAVALVHDLTLVTHNTPDYQNVPGLRLDDWLIP